MTIIAISVFYRNNVPNGFGYTFTLPPSDLDKVWTEITTNADAMWRAEPAHTKLQLISLMTDQLEAIVAAPEASRSFRDALLALMNVYLLEKMGVMPSDEFNGLVIARAIEM